MQRRINAATLWRLAERAEQQGKPHAASRLRRAAAEADRRAQTASGAERASGGPR
jgi:hypothetical protein